MKDFKIGDRVRDISVTRRFGTITSMNHYGDPDCLVVRFDDDEEGVCYVKDLEIFTVPKTAFLTELQSILRKYDAKISFGFNVKKRTCGVLFDIKDERIFYPFKLDEMDDDPATIWQIPSSNYPITPDNIFDYDKE